MAAAAVAASFLALQAGAQNPVVASVNGVKLFRVEAARAQLPEHYRHLPLEEVYQPPLTGLIRAELFAQRARAEDLHESAAVSVRSWGDGVRLEAGVRRDILDRESAFVTDVWDGSGRPPDR